MKKSRFHPDSANNPNFDPLLCDMMVNFRGRNNMSQREMANKLGVSKETVNNIESGRRGPSKMVRVRILDLIGGAQE